MNQYEKLLSIIQEQSVAFNSESLEIGEMTSKTTCKKGDLILDSEDLYIADHLTKRICTEVNISLVDGEIVDKSKYIEPLNAGDLVVLYRISDEKYLLIERVV